MYFFNLALKNVFSRKSSGVIIAFITVAIALLMIVNAIFDGTDNGIETIFKKGFTGDVVIREKSRENTSLFGNVSVIDESVIPTKELSNMDDLCAFLDNMEEVKNYIPQISTFSLLEVEDRKFKAAVFGVNIQDYLEMMDSITILEGEAPEIGESGCLVSQNWTDAFYHENHFRIHVGDTLQLVYSDGYTFRIRAVPVLGIYTYPFQNDILDRIVLVDADTVRSLLGRDTVFMPKEDLSQVIDSSMIETFDEDFDFDSLFMDEIDFEEQEYTGDHDPDIILTQTFKEKYADAYEQPDFEDKTDVLDVEHLSKRVSWDFIVIELNEGENARFVIRKINNFARKNGYNFQAVSWRDGAGMTAQYLFYLRVILILGIIVVMFAGLIVVDNSLIINIVDRTKEIGTMRSLGANKRNISALCMRETLILTVFSGILACIVSTIAIILITKFPIHLSNPFFIQLFASEYIIPELTLKNYIVGLAVSVAVGLTSWIFPVTESLKILPVVAMKGGK